MAGVHKSKNNWLPVGVNREAPDAKNEPVHGDPGTLRACGLAVRGKRRGCNKEKGNYRGMNITELEDNQSERAPKQG